MSDQAQVMERLMLDQTREMEQLKSELAEQTRTIIQEMMGEIKGTARQK